MIDNISTELLNSIAQFTDSQEKARLQQTSRALQHRICWKPQYPLDVPHRDVAADTHEDGHCTWKEACKEVDLMVPDLSEGTGDLQAAQRFLDRGSKRADLWRAIAHAQPVPPPPQNPVPYLKLLQEATHAQGRDISRHLQARIEGEQRIDDAIASGDTESVRQALASGARITFDRLDAMLAAYRGKKAGSYDIAAAMCQVIGEKGLAASLDNGTPPWVTDQCATSTGTDLPLLQLLLRAGFKLAPYRFFALSRDNNAFDAFQTALNHSNLGAFALNEAFAQTCYATGLQNKCERLALLKTKGAEGGKASMKIHRPRPNGMMNGLRARRFDASLPPMIAATFPPEPVLPTLKKLHDFGFSLHIKNRNGLTAWHGLALGEATDALEVAEFLHADAKGPSIDRTASFSPNSALTTLTALGALLSRRGDRSIPLLAKFLELGADPKGKHRNDDTVWALVEDEPDPVKRWEEQSLLLQHGAEPTKVVFEACLQNSGQTPEADVENLTRLVNAREWDLPFLTSQAFSIVRGDVVSAHGGEAEKLRVLFDTAGVPRNAILEPQGTPAFVRSHLAYNVPGKLPFAAFAIASYLQPHANEVGSLCTRSAHDEVLANLKALDACEVPIDAVGDRGTNAWHAFALLVARSKPSSAEDEAGFLDGWRAVAEFLSERCVDITATMNAAGRGRPATPLHVFLSEVAYRATNPSLAMAVLQIFVDNGALTDQSWANNDALVTQLLATPQESSEQSSNKRPLTVSLSDLEFVKRQKLTP